MSHLYDTIEPNVISENLLRQCVEEHGPRGEAGRVANAEGIDFTEVLQLRLDFKNILRIENLWQFTNLRKLQLDNNIIEEVSGLEKLIHLEWLDLSFNNIEVISGLDKLVNLKDLSLANNRIESVCNIDSLAGSLQVLSLANNLISDKKNVEYLRGFNKLETLAMKGNPISLEDDYSLFVVAFIPSLVYLDFRIINEDKKCEASFKYAELLSEVEIQEREDVRLKEAELAAIAEEQLLKSAYVDGLKGPVLFDSMFAEDSDASRIELFPGIKAKLERYKEEFIVICEQMSKVGLEEKEKRDKELASFMAGHKEACRKNQQVSVEKIKEYEELKLTTEDVNGLVNNLQHDLMWLEMQLVEQLDEIAKDFELNYGDMVGSFKESIQSHMTQLRELENKHHDAVSDLALTILEQFSRSQLEEDLPDDLRPLLVDKDTLVSTLNTSHDTHVIAIDNKEDYIAQRANKDLSATLEEVQKTEIARNRKKVAEIDQYISLQRNIIPTST